MPHFVVAHSSLQFCKIPRTYLLLGLLINEHVSSFNFEQFLFTVFPCNRLKKIHPVRCFSLQYVKKYANPARLFNPKFAKLSLLTVKKFLRQYHPRVGRWSLVKNSQNLLNVVKNDPLRNCLISWQAQPKHNCQIHMYLRNMKT